MTLPCVLFGIQLAATVFMTGLIWFVQVVHYPLFSEIAPRALPRYAGLHATRTGWVVGPPMVAEFVTAALLLVPRFRPPLLSAASAGTSFALVLSLWLVTGLVQVPLHTRLGKAHDVAAIRRLVSTNWIRSLLWSGRSVLLLTQLLFLLSKG